MVFITHHSGVGRRIDFYHRRSGHYRRRTAGKRGVVLGIYAAGFSFGFALGPLVIAVVGIQGWMPYIIAAIFTLAPSILVYTVGIGTLPDDGKTPLRRLSAFFGVARCRFCAPLRLAPAK